ncbi:MAG TPA: alpha-ketoglutarate-dependent dioxygenase AlkB [Burkholderiaceae bacterium]
MQPSLFANAVFSLPDGLRFVTDFLSPAEEAELLAAIGGLRLTEARYKQYVARRRVAAFGAAFDYETNELLAAPPIPEALLPLRAKVAAWLSVEPARFEQILVAEYRTGTPLGWHRDVPDFESIVGISLLGNARMRFRPYPPATGRTHKSVELDLPPRSAYVLEGPARWKWQHSIAPTPDHRYSISLRTRRGAPQLLLQAVPPNR